MLFLDYINLRGREPPKDSSQFSAILIDTVIIPTAIHPKLAFGESPSAEMIEAMRSGILEVMNNPAYRDQTLKVDIDECIQQGLRKYILLELDTHFLEAMSMNPNLLCEISRENDTRIELLSRATRWLASAYPKNHPITEIYREVSEKFNRCLKVYKSSLVHH